MRTTGSHLKSPHSWQYRLCRHLFVLYTETTRDRLKHLCVGELGSTKSDEELKTELERLRNENAALRKGASSGIRLKVSEKGAVSVYGIGALSRDLV